MDQPSVRGRIPGGSTARRHGGNLVVGGLILLLLVLQWPIVKGLFRRTAGGTPPQGSIAWRTDFAAALAEAESLGRPVLVDFTASWCAPCQVMKHEVWPDAEVGALADERFVPVLIDVDEDRETPARYDIRTIPTVLVLDAEGGVKKRAGLLSRDGMVDFLRGAAPAPAAGASAP